MKSGATVVPGRKKSFHDISKLLSLGLSDDSSRLQCFRSITGAFGLCHIKSIVALYIKRSDMFLLKNPFRMRLYIEEKIDTIYSSSTSFSDSSLSTPVI